MRRDSLCWLIAMEVLVGVRVLYSEPGRWEGVGTSVGHGHLRRVAKRRWDRGRRVVVGGGEWKGA